jgi:hypothetical protein
MTVNRSCCLCCLQGFHDLLHCGYDDDDHGSIYPDFTGCRLRCLLNVVFVRCGLGVRRWNCSGCCIHGVHLPSSDELGRNSAGGWYQGSGMLLLFDAATPSVAEGMVRLAVGALRFADFVVILRELSVGMANPVTETSWWQKSALSLSHVTTDIYFGQSVLVSSPVRGS